MVGTASIRIDGSSWRKRSEARTRSLARASRSVVFQGVLSDRSDIRARSIASCKLRWNPERDSGSGARGSS